MAARVCVGSVNPVKVSAVNEAFRLVGDFEAVGVRVDSGVPGQPVGACEVYRGAFRRAIAALDACGGSYGVGVESGLLPMPTPTGFLVAQAAVIVGPGRRVSGGLSGGFEVSPGIVGRMLEGVEMSRAFRHGRRVGDIGESIGYIGLATGGVVTRRELTLHALYMALTPWLSGGEWLPSAEEYGRRLEEVCGRV